MYQALQPNPDSGVPQGVQNAFTTSLKNTPSTKITEYNPFVNLKNSHNGHHFIEANTKGVALSHLRKDCVVPVFSKDNEVTISHPTFIETVYEAAQRIFPQEQIDTPDIVVSHIIKGRIPEAIHKPVNELLESDKTMYYERMAFCFEIPTIYTDIAGNRLNLSFGGVRAYNHENLYSKKTMEKFKIFIGFKNLVCCNMCVSTDGLKSELKVMNPQDLLIASLKLFHEYNSEVHIRTMNLLQEQQMTEHQFAQLIGKSRMYQYLPIQERKALPSLEFTDSHISAVSKAYYSDENFSRNQDSSIDLWRVYNLFTGANKSSYIDTFLDRSLNASQFVSGISKALSGDAEYRWFIE